MDIVRAPRRKVSKYVVWGGGLGAALVVLVGVSQIPSALPAVNRATMTTGTVHHGDMTVDVHAPGTLVPEHVRIIAAATAGRVESLPIRPGAAVTPAMTVVELSNPDVELQAMQSEQQLSGALSGLATLKTSLRRQRLGQEAIVAQTITQHEEALRSAMVFDSLDRLKLASRNEVAAARDRARELRTRMEIERQQLAEMVRSEKEQITLMDDQIGRLRAIVAAQQQRVHSMRVVAGESGQLQVLPLELGQWVNPGMELARVAQPGRLKAVLRVSESQARDIAVGQRATIDTRNGVVEGHVSRADPSSQLGNVTVEVALDGPLPAGTRSDLSVDGTIEVARLTNVLYIDRPATGDAGSSAGLFLLDAKGDVATRVKVKLGRASANAMQVTSGLKAGDRVIISDMSNWDNLSRVRIK